MWTAFGKLSVIPWILFAQSSWNMDAVPVITVVQPPTEVSVEVRDHAGVFGRDAERRAGEVLWHVYREHHFPVLIETVDSLDGAWVADVAQGRGRLAGADQFYVLVAGSEKEVGVIAARRGPGSRLTDQQREHVRRAFLGPLRAGDPDSALMQGTQALAATLNSAAGSASKAGGSNLRVKLSTLAVALAVLLAFQTWAWYGLRNRRRGRGSAGAAEPRHVVGPASVRAFFSRLCRATGKGDRHLEGSEPVPFFRRPA